MPYRYFSIVALFLSLLPIKAQVNGTGACDCWIEPDSTWIQLGHIGGGEANLWQGAFFDGPYCGPIALPFVFQFGGQDFDTLFINSYGAISFRSHWPSAIPASFPVPSPAVIAPFWSPAEVWNGPLMPDGVSMVSYKLTSSACYVSWFQMGYSNQHFDKLNSFQVTVTDGTDPVVPDGDNVAFCYKDMQWAGGGADGFGQPPATVGANFGDGVNYMQLGRFAYPDSVWNGTMVWSGIGWLNGRHLAFNAAPIPIPPFFSSTECDTVQVQVGDTGHYVITAHRGGPAPPMSASSICPSLTNYTVANQTVDGAHVLTATFIPVEGEEGLHTVYLQAATGIGAPSTTQRYINVLGTTGMAEHKMESPLSIFPNPAQGDAWIAWNGETAQEIQLIDAQGRTVRRIRPAGTDLHISAAGLPSGLYAVRMLAGGQVAVGRLFVAEP